MAWRMRGQLPLTLALVNVVNNVMHFKYELLSLLLSLSPLSLSLSLCNVVKNFAGSLTLHVLFLDHPVSPHACHQFCCRVARKFQVRQYMPRFYGFHVARAPVNDLGIIPALCWAIIWGMGGSTDQGSIPVGTVPLQRFN